MADSVKAAKPKKVSKPKVAPSHPKYINMVIAAIKDLKERKGSSRAAIMKHIIANNKVGTDVNKINPRVKVALRNGVKSGALKQPKGTGASGSFKVGEKEEKPKKKAPAKKPKVTKAKKPAAAKKPKAAKKSPKKVKKAKTPKKAAAKPAAKKAAKPKKPAAKKSPKKTKAAKPKAAKKAAGKK